MDTGQGGFRAAEDENISRTYWTPTRAASAEPCGYVVSGTGGAARFCTVPAERGSSYCRLHRALCEVHPDSPEAAAIVAEFEREAERPPLPGVGCDPLLETALATEPDEAMEDLAIALASAMPEGEAP